MKNLKLLIKFPTRSRPDKFLKILDQYYLLLRDTNYKFIISCDLDDITMNNDNIKNKLSEYPNLKYYYENNTSKIEAINNNLSGEDFDILLLASDDMLPIKSGYDKIIKENMEKYFPDTDGVLWFNDGFQKHNLNTLSILGKKYYDRFNYIYHPDYKSLYCDLEFTLVTKKLNRVKYIDDIIIKHIQYSIVNETPDELYIKNDNLENIDKLTFEKRSKNNFQ